MKKLPLLPTMVMLIGGLTVGLIVGAGVSHIQIKGEQKIFQDKIKEANKKIAFIQKKAAEEKNDLVSSTEQKFQADLDKLQNEKKGLEERLGTMKEQVQEWEKKVRESDESITKAGKELHGALTASAETKKELQEMERNNKALGEDLRKTTAELQARQTELQKTTQELGHSELNNAELCLIAEELLKKYRDKGFGAVFLTKEPLTQLKKMELEHFTQEYQDAIEKLRTKKKDVGKNAAK